MASVCVLSQVVVMVFSDGGTGFENKAYSHDSEDSGISAGSPHKEQVKR